jgi:glycosyltransferase involved in cell wall biosynthesis
MDISTRITIAKSNWVVFSTLDSMKSSRMHLKASSKSVEIFPFVNFRDRANPLFNNEIGRNFGYLGRFTSEKGAIFLIEAFRAGASKHDRLLMAGSSKVAGDSVFEKVKIYAAADSRIILYPDISESDIPGFYSSLDAFCFPSLNSFEAFGISQVEALLAGIPVITSDLPGVRIPVRLTNMGQVLPVGNIQAWSTALKVYDRDFYPERISKVVEQQFSRDIAVKRYLKLLN